VAEIQGQSDGEFGFLSEPKLLNTALTRAKSWIGVVGDPVAICAIGGCGQIWQKYLDFCQSLGSIQPKEISCDIIRMRTEAFKQEILTIQQDTFHSGQSTAAAMAIFTLNRNFDDQAKLSFQEWSLDYQFEPDEIIRQLAMV
jgi:hypothetical protein